MSTKRFQKNVELWGRVQSREAVYLQYVETPDFAFCHTDAGELNLRKKEGLNSIHFHSMKDANAESKKWFSRLDTEGKDVLYVYGVGLGYAYNAARDWLHSRRKRRLIFLEDDIGVIRLLFETELGSRLIRDPKTHLYYFPSVTEGKDVINQLYWHETSSNIAVSALPLYAKRKAEIYNDFHHAIVHDTLAKDRVMREFLQGGAQFFRNFYVNLKEMPKATLGNGLFQRFQNVPAIICGAGPSLGKQIPQLSTLSEKALIFAGGSAINALNTGGIQPHLAATIDPNPAQYTRFSQNWAFEVPTLYRTRVFPPVLQLLHGPRLYITGNGGYIVGHWFEKQFGIKSKVEVEEGHNVIFFCLDLALHMKCNPIIFVGMDQAYTGMQLYSPGVVEAPKVSRKEIVETDQFEDSALLRKDIYGKPIYTLWKWLIESESMGLSAKEHPKATIINATEGGIGFPHIPNQSLTEVIEEHCSRSFDLLGRLHGEIQNSTLTGITNEKVEAAMKRFKRSFTHCIDYLTIILNESKQVLKQIQKEKRVPPILETPHASFAEMELQREPAYKYVLNLFNMVYFRVLHQEMRQLRTSSKTLSEYTKAIRTVRLTIKKLLFLRKTAETNMAIINLAMEKQL